MINDNRVKNDEATVTLRAFRGVEQVDSLDTHGRLEPAVQYIEFATKARALYRATRITMEVAFILLLTLGPIISAAGASNGTTKYLILADRVCGWQSCPLDYAQPDAWYGKKTAISYQDIWNNSLRQTPIQYVAIVAMVQEEGSVQPVLKRVRRELDRLKQDNMIDTIKEGMRTDRYGPTPYVNNSATHIWTATALAMFCVSGLLLMFSVVCRADHKNYRKMWKQRRRSI